MFSQMSNLDDVIIKYLRSPTLVLQERLIRSGHAVVNPLLNSVAIHISTYGASVKSQREREIIKAYDWTETVFQPLLLPAYQIISQIGEPARFQLCKSIRQPDRRVQKAAALFLALHANEDAPSVHTITQIRDVFWSTKMNDTSVVMLLTFVLARGGDAASQQAVEQHARDNRMSLEEWIIKTIDTAVLELLGWTQEVLR